MHPKQDFNMIKQLIMNLNACGTEYPLAPHLSLPFHGILLKCESQLPTQNMLIVSDNLPPVT